ncbi:lipoprotein-anchoring transpeptidase ErfK/SrfK [Catenulispora sp. GP43]|uniref:L,D-transpeptidase n=1 Tax=Catenulispora sp. GP43 TaxID=3156263 RepID=UPI003510DC8C
MARQHGRDGSAGAARRVTVRPAWRRAVQLTAVAAAATLLAAGCGSSSGSKPSAAAPAANGSSAPSAGGSSGTTGATTPSAPATPLVLSAKPADGATNVDPSTGIQISVAGGKIESVTAQDGKGDKVNGALAADGSSWSSTGTLFISSSYTVTGKAVDGTGAEKDISAKFTTMTPQKRLGLQSYFPDDGTTVGVGQPVSVTFTNPPNAKDRANVEKAMTVTTTPHVDGAWSWITATQVDWRPQNFWASGTKVSVQMNLNGVKAGDVTYGSFTKGFSFTVGRDQRAVVDTAHFTMHVFQDGKEIKQIPTDTGMKGYSTWNGTMVVLDKQPMIEMKSCSVPGFSCTPGVGNYYDLKVYDDVHLTTSGTYVHAAGWDNSIGTDNTSHGCVHLKPADADWFYNFINVGDPVTITGEPDMVHNGNGFTDWNESWQTWLAGSAAGVSAAPAGQ